MSKVEAAGPLRDGETCGICLVPRGSDDDRRDHRRDSWVTHELDPGVKPHDAFHLSCLVSWLKRHPTCPTCREYIDTNSVLSRTERIFQRLKTAAKVTTIIGVATGTAAALGAAVGKMGAEKSMAIVAKALEVGAPHYAVLVAQTLAALPLHAVGIAVGAIGAGIAGILTTRKIAPELLIRRRVLPPVQIESVLPIIGAIAGIAGVTMGLIGAHPV